jgi:hypothetical protein
MKAGGNLIVRMPRPENDCAPDYDCNRADHSHRIKSSDSDCESQQPYSRGGDSNL